MKEVQPGDDKSKTPPKCEISLMGRSAFVPVQKPVKSLDQIQRERAAQLESPSPTESVITEPAIKPSVKSVSNDKDNVVERYPTSSVKSTAPAVQDIPEGK